MIYFFMNYDPERFGHLKKRIPSLSRVQSIDGDQASLVRVLSETPNAVFFLLYGESDNFAPIIRGIGENAKIVYLTTHLAASELKGHQQSSLGGDAYVPLQVDEHSLLDLLNGLFPKSAASGDTIFQEYSDLRCLENPICDEVDGPFKAEPEKTKLQSIPNFTAEKTDTESITGDQMDHKDKELSLEDLGDLGELEITSSSVVEEDHAELEMTQEGEEFELGDAHSLEDEECSLEPKSSYIDIGELEFSLDDGIPAPPLNDCSNDLSLRASNPSLAEEAVLTLDAVTDSDFDLGQNVSNDVLSKLQEIDAIMELDSSRVNIDLEAGTSPEENAPVPSAKGRNHSDFSRRIVLRPEDLNEPLVSDDLNLDGINFETGTEEEAEKEEKPKKKKKEKEKEKEIKEARSDDRDYFQELKDISGAYSGEMERTQATISNLRADREELLKNIQELEDEKVMQNRHVLNLRAELDEKKIELSIIRKKLNEENSELKDRMKVMDERRLILEEKNRFLAQEIDKVGQRNKIDVKKVQMRERELEQKLELLKADSETQIRNRDLKILELKRKLDGMEFDMESISQQEKRSVESRFELEDKLDKAIKTLRSAISVLEDESDRGRALEALKKNIDV